MRAAADAVRMSKRMSLMLVPLFAELWQAAAAASAGHCMLLNSSWPRAICARLGFP